MSFCTLSFSRISSKWYRRRLVTFLALMSKLVGDMFEDLNLEFRANTSPPIELSRGLQRSQYAVTLPSMINLNH